MLLELFIAFNIRYVFLSFDSIKTIIIIIIIIFKFSARPWNSLRSRFVRHVNSCASTSSWETLLMEESNFLENVEKQMRKSRVKSPVVSNSRG